MYSSWGIAMHCREDIPAGAGNTAVRKQKDLIPNTHKESERTGSGPVYKNLKACPSWRPSSGKALSPKGYIRAAHKARAWELSVHVHEPRPFPSVSMLWLRKQGRNWGQGYIHPLTKSKQRKCFALKVKIPFYFKEQSLTLKTLTSESQLHHILQRQLLSKE